MLSPEDRSKALSHLLLWRDDDEDVAVRVVSSSTPTGRQRQNAISKTYEFPTVPQAWFFLSLVTQQAQELNHYPAELEWSNNDNNKTVVVTLTTRLDCGTGSGVSQKDITLAETTDACAGKVLQQPQQGGGNNNNDNNATPKPKSDTAIQPAQQEPSPSSVQTTPTTLLTFVPTCDLYDEYLDTARVIPCAGGGCAGNHFQHVGGKTQFCGIAITVKCFEDNSKIKELLSSNSSSGKGKVLVVDGGGPTSRCALLGDLIAQSAVDHQWEGLIFYGLVRDVQILKTLDSIGIMALGMTPRKSVRRGEGQIDLPIQIGGGTWCKPGDKVYADENGIVILD